eukprot:TRINITY_DN5651_c0_g1_i1.p1 TRINITY_DN5651_c0_g1~~TRINITY_DN5651_c0_g1_i1.p1  ORF type:complete len:429 (+),score=148.53 TRINITY_DN5651_c0_g1_i1:570-1856(+)
MNHQIEQLKEEVASRDKALVEESFQQKKAEKLADTLKGEAQALKGLREAQTQRIGDLEHEVQQLTQIIADCDTERVKQKRKVQRVLGEREVLSAQLLRRNEELALLHEKIRIQQSVLSKGETQYQERVADVRTLRLTLRDMKRALHLTQGHAGQVEELKRHAVQLQNECSAERARVKVLSEELETPTNVHRWRQLEGSDPKEFELIQKVQVLQKRLIAKTQECAERELAIREKDKLYAELKALLARQPGPEVAEHVNAQHESLQKCQGQIKRLTSELNMATAQVDEYKYEIERLSRELTAAKQRFYDQKAKTQKLTRDKPLPGLDRSPATESPFTITFPPGAPASPAAASHSPLPSPDVVFPLRVPSCRPVPPPCFVGFAAPSLRPLRLHVVSSVVLPLYLPLHSPPHVSVYSDRPVYGSSRVTYPAL